MRQVRHATTTVQKQQQHEVIDDARAVNKSMKILSLLVLLHELHNPRSSRASNASLEIVTKHETERRGGLEPRLGGRLN